MKLRQYLFNQLALTFFPIFLGLYFITSIIFLVKIASLTSVITINFFELIKLYGFMMPSIIFYTLPVSFFISVAITLSKLSNEYELIVVTSFGLNPLKILKIFLPITVFISLSLIVVSLGLIPKTKYEREVFMDKKQTEANFNIKASEFGQNLGNWLIFIEKKDEKFYHNVKLFKTQENQDQFIIAKNATLNNDEGELSFKLFEGKSFHIQDEEFNQIDYSNMTIFNNIRNNHSGYTFIDSYNYWKHYLLDDDSETQKFAYYILLSFFPLLSLLIAVNYGYYNPRYEKSRAVQWCAFYIVIYYSLISFLTKQVYLHSLYIIPVLWISWSYFLYTRSVKKQY